MVTIVNASSAPKTTRYPRTCTAMSCAIVSEQIQHRKQEDPHHIDKVPVDACDLDAVRESLRLAAPHPGARPPQVSVDDHADDDVKRVQSRQREIQAEEVVRCRVEAV